MVITEEKKQGYIEDVKTELRRRGLTTDEIPRVIGKTGFMEAMEQSPEIQFHYDVRDAVDEILVTAARN